MTSRRQNTVLSLLPREVRLDMFLYLFSMYARPIQVQIKVHFKNLQFLAMAYDMSCWDSYGY